MIKAGAQLNCVNAEMFSDWPLDAAPMSGPVESCCWCVCAGRSPSTMAINETRKKKMTFGGTSPSPTFHGLSWDLAIHSTIFRLVIQRR